MVFMHERGFVAVFFITSHVLCKVLLAKIRLENTS